MAKMAKNGKKGPFSKMAKTPKKGVPKFRKQVFFSPLFEEPTVSENLTPSDSRGSRKKCPKNPLLKNFFFLTISRGFYIESAQPVLHLAGLRSSSLAHRVVLGGRRIWPKMAFFGFFAFFGDFSDFIVIP